MNTHAHRLSPRASAAAVALLLAIACSPRPDVPERPPIVVQGAMPVETDQLASRLEGVRTEKIGGWTFWRGTIDGYPVVVSRTMKGVANAAAATAIAVERYRPAAILNQGTAGGHNPELHVYDIVVGTYSVSLGGFRTGFRDTGQGSDSLEWTPLDLMASEGSAGQDPRAQALRRFPASAPLVAAALSVRGQYRHGRVLEGVIGSSDMWNSELDRIARFNSQYGTTVEEMETAPAAQVAALYQVPFLGIRVLSNNITNGGAYDARSAEACQEYVYDVIRAYIAAGVSR